MIRPIIAGNWKMHKTVEESVNFAHQLRKKLSEPVDGDVIIAPPFTALFPVAEALKGASIHLSAQNLHWEEEGAYTGEISAGMLVGIGCEYVIIGHSERRILFNENSNEINRKIKTALKFNLGPIFCVGETLSERESGQTFSVIKRQIEEGLFNLSSGDTRSIVLAYEPVWAIGTGKTATPGQAEEVHRFIRDTMTEIYGKDTSSNTAILYGGSVNPDNISDLINQPDIGGALVGGASLDVERFIKIVKRCF
jgi:triosephosphate isomerase